jgi:hypothetical protein
MMASEMNAQGSRTMTPGASLGVFGAGLLIQMLSFPLLHVLSVCLHEQPVGQVIVLVLMLIWFGLPLFGIFGIIIGVKCYLRSIGTFLPFLGIVMNALWLAALGLASFYLFVVKVSA